MEKEKREDFIKRMSATSDRGSISDDWQKLVKGGTIAKLMEREEAYKKSGGYPELSEEDSER